MKKMMIFFRGRIADGLLLLLPMFVLLAVMLKAWHWLHRLIRTLSVSLGMAQKIGVTELLCITTLCFVLLCFLAGWMVQWRVVSSLKEWVEQRMLRIIPGYSYLNSELQAHLKMGSKGSACVLVRLGHSWRPGVLVEGDTDDCTVFIPNAPDPRSGCVYVVSRERLRQLNINFNKLHGCMKQYGKGVLAVIDKPLLFPKDDKIEPEM